MAAARPRRGRRGRLDRPGRRDRSACRTTCATRCGAWTPPALAPVDAPGRPDRRRHGRLGASAARLARARAAARGCARPLALADGYELPAWTGPEHARAVLELLGQHRGDARRLRRRAARPARRASCATTGGALAERARARRRAGDPAARRLPAARGGRLLARGRAGGGGAVRAPRRRCATRSRRPRALARALAAEWGPDGDEDGEAKRLARALHGTVPVIAGAGLDRGGRLPLEVPVQRERRSCRRSRPSCPRPTTTRSSAGPTRATLGALRRRLPRGPRRRRARCARGSS